MSFFEEDFEQFRVQIKSLLEMVSRNQVELDTLKGNIASLKQNGGRFESSYPSSSTTTGAFFDSITSGCSTPIHEQEDGTSRNDLFGTTSGSNPFSATSGSDPFGATSRSDLFGTTSGSNPFSATSGSDPIGATSGSDPFGATSGSDPIGATSGSDVAGVAPGSDGLSSKRVTPKKPSRRSQYVEEYPTTDETEDEDDNPEVIKKKLDGELAELRCFTARPSIGVDEAGTSANAPAGTNEGEGAVDMQDDVNEDDEVDIGSEEEPSSDDENEYTADDILYSDYDDDKDDDYVDEEQPYNSDIEERQASFKAKTTKQIEVIRREEEERNRTEEEEEGFQNVEQQEQEEQEEQEEEEEERESAEIIRGEEEERDRTEGFQNVEQKEDNLNDDDIDKELAMLVKKKIPKTPKKGKFRKGRRAGADADADAGVRRKRRRRKSNLFGASDEILEGIRKPLTSFMIYSLTVRANIKNQFPGLTFGQIAKKIGEGWKQLDSQQKGVYESKARRDQCRFEEEVLKAMKAKEATTVVTPTIADTYEDKMEAGDENMY